MLPNGTIQLGPTGEVALCTLALEGNLLGGASIRIMAQGRERDTPVRLQLDHENSVRLLRDIAAVMLLEPKPPGESGSA
jgi:hypothetical protein